MTGGLLGRAAADVGSAPRLWAIGLAGFLASGGILLIAVPIVVLPSVVGVSTFVGPNAITAAGPSPRFVELVAAGALAVGAWIVFGTLVSVAAERALVLAVVGPRMTVVDPAGLVRLFTIRLVSLAPFGLAVALGGARLGQVGYQELIRPSDSTAPFVLRVLFAAPEVVALLAVGWLISELVGAVGIRLALIEGPGTFGSIGGALRWIVGHPLRCGGLIGATVLVGGALIGVALGASMVAWSTARDALLGGAAPGLTGLTVVLFVGVWACGLTLAGVVAAWRSAAWSLAVVGDHRVGGPIPGSGGTL